MKRVAAKGQERPLLRGKNNLDEIRALISYRKPYYDRAADIKVNTSHLGEEEVVEQILAQIKNENFNKSKSY